MARGLSFGGLLGIGLLAYVGYQYFTADSDLCSRESVQSTLTKILSDNKVGTSLKVSAIRTENKDGRKSMCAAQFDWNRSDNSKPETLLSVHYSAIPTDDGKHIMVEIPGPDLMAIRMEGLND